MALIDELETLVSLMRQLPEVEEEAERWQVAAKNALDNVAYVKEGIEEIRQRVCDLLMPPNIVVDGPQAPAQPLPSVEGVTVTPATEENSGGPPCTCHPDDAPFECMKRYAASECHAAYSAKYFPPPPGAEEASGGPIIDAQTCEPVDPHVSWEPPPPTEAEPDSIVDAPSVEIPEGFTKWEGGECPVDPRTLVYIIQRNGRPDQLVAGAFSNPDPLFDQWVHSSFRSGEDIIAYRIIEEAGGYAPVTDGDPAVEPESGLHGEPASVLDDPELVAAVERAEAKLEDEKKAARALVDAELDAELDRVREQERAKAKHHFSIFGKLEDA